MRTSSSFRGSRATTLVSLFICCTLLFSTLVSAGSGGASVTGQTQSRRGNPEAGPPEATLPNLEEVRRRRHPRPETPAPLPSLMRSRRKSLVPRNGRKVGDLLTDSMSSNSDHPVLTIQGEPLTIAGVTNRKTMTHPPEVSRHSRGKLHHSENYSSSKSSRRLLALAPPITDDDYVQRWFTYAFVRSANPTESSYWDDLLRAASAHGQPSLVMAARELGKTLFESAEYATRARSNHDYIYDLYKPISCAAPTLAVGLTGKARYQC